MPQTFRLQSLLVSRQQQREHERVLLASVLAGERELETQRAAIERELWDEQHRARGKAAPGRIDVAGLTAAKRHEATLRDRLAAVTERQQALEKQIASQQQAVMDADCEVRKLEKLRDRHNERQRLDASRTEVTSIDEVSTTRAKQSLTI